MTQPVQTCLLVYDIPDTAELPNPSGRLRRLGFRVNLSCWAIPERRLPWNLLDELTSGGCLWHVVRFDEAEAEKLTAMAVAALRKEVETAAHKAEESLARAETAFRNGETSEEELATFRRRSMSALSRARRLLSAEEAARGFGIAAIDLQLKTAQDSIAALSASFHARAHVYAQMTVAAAGTEMQAAAETNEVPAIILADYLEEQGKDTAAARAAF